MYENNPVAIRLRELQTITEVAREKNLIVVTPTTVGSEFATMVGVMKQSRTEKQT